MIIKESASRIKRIKRIKCIKRALKLKIHREVYGGCFTY